MQISIFTDGASRGNPGPGGWAAVIVLAGEEGAARVVELGGTQNPATNNQMELLAAIKALENVSAVADAGALEKDVAALTVNTDSSYLIGGITKWLPGWKQKGWITSTKKQVENRDLWERLDELTSDLSDEGIVLRWNYVGGHVGVLGNERCDEIATALATRSTLNPPLYSGPLSSYFIKDVLNVGHSSENKAERSGDRSRKRAQAYSYVSEIGGKVQVHKTWAECEARVKGQRAARYKKALSPSEEAALIESFS